MNWKEFTDKEDGFFIAEKEIYRTEYGEKRNCVIFYETITNDDAFVIYENGKFNLKFMYTANSEICKDVVDFINQGKNEWFKDRENKYNIVVGEDVASEGSCFIQTRYRAYAKNNYDDIEIYLATKNDLKNDKRFLFNQDEINNLKSKLPKNMARIVDLGKTEVKTDE